MCHTWSCHKCRYAGNDECWWGDWRCAALAHNSFLYHYWQGSLSAYEFGLYDFSYPDYERWWGNHQALCGPTPNAPVNMLSRLPASSRKA